MQGFPAGIIVMGTTVLGRSREVRKIPVYLCVRIGILIVGERKGVRQLAVADSCPYIPERLLLLNRISIAYRMPMTARWEKRCRVCLN